ncbi:MAG: DNA primase [Bacillota bacterium]
MNVHIPEHVLDEIRSATDIVDVVSEYVVLQKRGRNYWGRCPFHTENTPSFTVSNDKQMFYCFGCGTGGSAYTFLMKIRNISFVEAANMLAERAGISLPEKEQSPQERLVRKKQQRLLDLLALAAEYFQNNLSKHPDASAAIAYLKQRGINGRIAKEFRLGWALETWDQLIGFLSKNGFAQQEIHAAGLASPREKGVGYYDRFRGRLMFPIIDHRQRIVGFGGRVLDTSVPKYLNSPETQLFQKGKILYGLSLAADAIRQAGYAIIVEGYMDTIAAHQYGFANTVASLGTALTREQAQLLKRFTRDVVIAYDADAAGEKATLRGLELLQEVGCRVKVAVMPPKMDPDDFIRKYGAAVFKELMEKRALSLIAYKLEKEIVVQNTETVEGKVDVVNHLLPDLQRLDNAIERGQYIKLIAGRLDLAEDAIYFELNRRSGKMQKNGTGRDKKEIPRHNKDEIGSLGLLPSEEYLLLRILEEPEALDQVQAELGQDVFQQQAARDIIQLLQEWMAVNLDPPSPAALADLLPSGAARDLLARVMSREKVLGGSLPDLLRQIKICRLSQQVEERQRRIREAESAGDLEVQRQLIVELTALQREKEFLKRSKQ